MKNKELLICDLDNTLYDWVAYFVPSFYDMVNRAVEVTGCEKEQMLDDLRSVHQNHHNSEHPFALIETTSIQNWLKLGDYQSRLNELDSAFHAFNSTRKRTLKLYDGVLETLKILKGSGIKLLAHSDSNYYSVVDRVQRLGLTNFFEKVYCTEPSEAVHPRGEVKSKIFKDFPESKVALHSSEEKKPNPQLLDKILYDQEVAPNQAAYVGDSLSKDVYMAKEAGVFAIWASYGVVSEEPLYDSLVRISHWTSEDVAREREISRLTLGTSPDFVCIGSFSEVLAPLLSLPSQQTVHGQI